MQSRGGGVSSREQWSRDRSLRGGVSENWIEGSAAACLFFLIAIATRPFKFRANSSSSFVSSSNSFGFREEDQQLLNLPAGRCRLLYLGWPIAPSYMSPNAGGGGKLRGLSQWAQLYTGAPINFGDLTQYLSHACHGLRSALKSILVRWVETNVIFRLIENCIGGPPYSNWKRREKLLWWHYYWYI
jgi:hypothetical protein